MYATRGECAMSIVKQPPLALVTAVWDRRKSTELGRIAPGTNRLNNLYRKEAHAVYRATVQNQKTKPPQIAQAGGYATASKGYPLAIHGLVGSLLGSHWAPKPFRGQFGHRFSGHAADDPSKHIRVDRLVLKRGAMCSIGLYLPKVIPIAIGPLVSCGLGQRTRCCGIEPDIGLRI